MGLTKQYLRYVPTAVFGVVGSSKSNIIFVEVKGQLGKYAAVAAVENVFLWDLKKAEKILTLKGDKHEASILAIGPNKSQLAVGYMDGSIRLFDLTSGGEPTVTFKGHKSAVTALTYDSTGMHLVSGSKDTDVIVWDVVSENGLYRLKGHKGMVTDAVFMKEHNILITGSKDTFVKFWDLDTQHCFKTLVGHRTEVWGLSLISDNRLVTGAVENELSVWDISFRSKEGEGEPPQKKAKMGADLDGDEEDKEEDEEETDILSCTKVGVLKRSGRDRVITVKTDKDKTILGVHGKDNYVELFVICTEEEKKKFLQKKKKRARKKAQASSQEEEEGVRMEDAIELTVDEEIKNIGSIKAGGKIRSFDIITKKTGEKMLVVLLHNNKVEVFQWTGNETMEASQGNNQVALPAHRSDVRALCFNADNTAILSGSAEAVKMWNRNSQQCVRTVSSGYVLSLVFVPGERHCIAGTKDGHLQLFDIAGGKILEDVEAHRGELWSIAVCPDKRGFMTGSADKEIKFWEFEFVDDEEQNFSSKRLSFQHIRTLKMSDDILCVKYSPDQKFIAASLLDSTVKVFFADTLKFFLSMYGHKLPVLSMDISTDSTLLVTGSADRNIKIWGMDFGDCHKSMFAHDDSVMCVQFVPRTHLFFSCGKDGKIKQWDADSFEHIVTLQGHHAEVWTLAISPSGDFVVSASHDKSLRLWERTEEPLILTEEREMEREKEYEESLNQGDPTVIAGETSEEVTLAATRTVESVKGAERIMEAIELYKEETEKMKEYQADCQAQNKKLPPPQPNPILKAYGDVTPSKYVCEVLKKVKSSELEESLLVMPFSYVLDLFPLLEIFINQGWEVELSCRCLFFLLRVNHGQITSSQVLLPIIDRLRSTTLSKVAQLKDTIGFNLAGLQFMQQQIEAKGDVQFFSDATDQFKEKKRKKKKAEGKVILAMAAAGL